MSITNTQTPFSRRIFANRTLNMRALRAIGYDMDYTLVHYDVKAWEALAFDFLKKRLLALGWPVQDADFTPDFGMRGLIIDTKLGNIVKANRFGYIKKALHGFEPLPFDMQKETYNRDFVDLGDSRWEFVNTFFSLSEISMFAHAVVAFDAHRFPTPMTYASIAQTIRCELDAAHLEGAMKCEIAKAPETYVMPDPDAGIALRDQQIAGKKTILITNSEWAFTDDIMRYSYEGCLPAGSSWTDLFDLIVVSSRKPNFFTQNAPIYRVITESGLLEPVNAIDEHSKIYHGGSAQHVEAYLGHSGDEILYVGDHVYSDVNVSKAVRRWRTCLISRELEEEIEALNEAHDDQATLDAYMHQKDALERSCVRLEMALARARSQGGAIPEGLQATWQEMRTRIRALETKIAPYAIKQGQLFNPHWGLFMRTGNDKSLMARQIEQHADIYTSRVSNFLEATPYAFLRSTRGILPHDLCPSCQNTDGV